MLLTNTSQCIFTSLALGNVTITDRKQDDYSRKNVVVEPYPLHLLRRRRVRVSEGDSEREAVAEAVVVADKEKPT